MKEKIMGELMPYLRSLTGPKSESSGGEDETLVRKVSDEIEMVRSQLDQKFNYTLTRIYNELADQMRVNKAQESELSQVRSVLDELNARYTALLGRLQKRDDDENGAAAEETDTSKTRRDLVKEELESDEHVSFRMLEEYVKRTFKVYDADKTGMTDYASDSLGAAILFTKCTETYQDNSRWLTVLNMPITRITTSPRVVIQVLLAPLEFILIIFYTIVFTCMYREEFSSAWQLLAI